MKHLTRMRECIKDALVAVQKDCAASFDLKEIQVTVR
jgi:hypothetical protein